MGQPPLQYGVFLGLTEPTAASATAAEWDEFWAILDRCAATTIAGERDAGRRRALAAMHARLAEVRGDAETERDLIVGYGGQRFEVNLAAAGVAADDLREGQEVVLNKAYNVVGARAGYLRGDTAEVVNVISPTRTARVMTIPDQGDLIQVQWAGGDKAERFEVEYPPELREKSPLKRGDIVSLDEDNRRAMEKVKPRLHVRSGGSEGIVVEISERLFEEGVDIGDTVRVDPRLQFAFEKLPSYQTGGLALEEVPDVSFNDIGGLDEEIDQIQDAIELPYLHRHLFDEYALTRTKGIMLHGPPGCGKTMIAKAIANSLTQSIQAHLQRLTARLATYIRLRDNPGDPAALAEYAALRGLATTVGLSPADARQSLADELRANDVDPDAAEDALRHIQGVLGREDGVRSFFLNIKGPELLSKWVGESEHRIRKIFEEAKRNASYYTPVVIFFDEMEAMFRARGSGRSSDVETTIVPQFLSEMDGVESAENVIIIGASNRHDLIDPAIMRPGRLDVKIKVDRPKLEAAHKILALNLTPDLPLSDAGLPPPADGRRPLLSFKPQVTQRTLAASGRGLPPAKRAALLRGWPPGRDVRAALADGVTDAWGDDTAIAGVLREAARREWLAEAIIAETAALLFSKASRLEITTNGKNPRYTFPLEEFVSGAQLAGIVARAKKAAVKRRALLGVDDGIAIADMSAAIYDEFEESGEQLAAYALETELQPGEKVVEVQVKLDLIDDDPWNMEKVRAYPVPGEALREVGVA